MRWVVAVAIVIAVGVVGCGSRTSDPNRVRARARDTCTCTYTASSATCAELVTGIVDGWSSTKATLRLWRCERGEWQPVGAPWPAVIGQAGAAWAGKPPDGRSGPVKHEGDRRSPAGRFRLVHVYGYAAAPPAGTTLPYTPVDASWQCVDDPRSKQYARVVDRRTVEVDWKSAEQMRRDDAEYTWVIDTEYNHEQVPQAGSCIFLHVWNGPETATIGCTAMAEPDLAHLVGALAPGATYVLLPRAEYDALAEPWGLPKQ